MTGCERILERLRHGPATAVELYAETYSIVHSRISELRRRGFDITCERDPDESGARSYLYRLVREPETSAEVAPLPAGSPDPGPEALSAEQLSLEVAA